jgi:hypothetical protein
MVIYGMWGEVAESVVRIMLVYRRRWYDVEAQNWDWRQAVVDEFVSENAGQG